MDIIFVAIQLQKRASSSTLTCPSFSLTAPKSLTLSIKMPCRRSSLTLDALQSS
uniref:Uncharacterized protein n=1 Tax=Anguilla anguilla TaxID=7936 RepID=A0A0E9PSJ7_ANGAN